MRLRYFWPWLKQEFRWRVLGNKYEIVMTEEAQRNLEDLPKEDQVEIMKAIERISRNPYSGERFKEFEGLKNNCEEK